MREFVVVGGGEHALVVADAIETGELGLVVGYSAPEESLLSRSYQWLGRDEDLPPDQLCVLGIGARGADPVRAAAVAAVPPGTMWAAIVHPSAIVAPTARIDPGAVVLAGAIIQPQAHLMEFSLVGAGSTIEHDVTLGSYAVVAPGVTIGGGTTIGRNAFIGLGAGVRDHLRIGEGAVVSMGSIVTNDISPNTTVRGLPARPIG